MNFGDISPKFISAVKLKILKFLSSGISLSNKCYCLSPVLFGEAECEQILKWMSDAAIEAYEPINFEQTDILDRYIF